MNRQIQGYQQSTYEATRDVYEKKTEFIIEKLRRSITYLKKIADCDFSKIEYEELKQRKSKIQGQRQIKGDHQTSCRPSNLR